MADIKEANDKEKAEKDGQHKETITEMETKITDLETNHA